MSMKPTRAPCATNSSTRAMPVAPPIDAAVLEAGVAGVGVHGIRHRLSRGRPPSDVRSSHTKRRDLAVLLGKTLTLVEIKNYFNQAMSDPARKSLRRMVRHERQERLHVPELDEEPGHPGRRVPGQADHRHLQHLVGADALQRGLPASSPSEYGAACSRPAATRSNSRCRETAESNRARPRCSPQPRQTWTSRRRSRGNPIDAVVLMVGCDRTTPALLMGAASCDVPAIAVSGGRSLNGGRDIGSGTAVWQLSEQVKAGTITLHEFMSAEAGFALGRHLQHHGHPLDHGLHGRGARRHPAATRRSRRSTRGERAGAPLGNAHRADGARGADAVEDPPRAHSRTRSG